MLAAAQELACALRRRGATEVRLFGSLAAGPGGVGPVSDVDMAVAMPGVEGQRPHLRLNDVPEVLDFPYALDLFVYSPAEWYAQSTTAFFQQEVLAKGRPLGER